MLDCALAQCYLSARLDGALTPEETAALEAHLAECPACRTLSEELALVHQAMTELPPVQPPPQLKADILARIAAEPRKTPKHSAWRKWLAPAALFALVLLGAYGLTLGGASGGGSSPPQALDANLEQQALSEEPDQIGGSSVDSPTAGGGSNAGGSARTADPALRMTTGSEPSAAPAGNAANESTEEGTTHAKNALSLPAPEAARESTPVPTPYTADSGGLHYCGVLTLSWDEAAPLLEDLPYTQEGDTRSYLLSSAAFEGLIQSLPASEDIDLVFMDTEADQGLVLVTGAPNERVQD